MLHAHGQVATGGEQVATSTAGKGWWHAPEAADEGGNGVCGAVRFVLVHSVPGLQQAASRLHLSTTGLAQAAQAAPPAATGKAGPKRLWSTTTPGRAAYQALPAAAAQAGACPTVLPRHPLLAKHNILLLMMGFTCGSSTGWNLPCICPIVSGRSSRSVPTSTSTCNQDVPVGRQVRSPCDPRRQPFLVGKPCGRTEPADLPGCPARMLSRTLPAERMYGLHNMPRPTFNTGRGGNMSLPAASNRVSTHPYLGHGQGQEHVTEAGVPAFPVRRRLLQLCAPHPARAVITAAAAAAAAT